jgi:hypothetical protein
MPPLGSDRAASCSENTMTTKYIPAKSRSIHTWWEKKPSEIFWLEVTGRSDIGVNLKAPQTNEHGDDFWSYSLLKYVPQGDVIFHYNRVQQAIVAQSIATGEFWIDKITWAARGAYAREAGIQPHARPGWYVGLENYKPLKTSLELELIRAFQKEISKLINELTVEVGSPLYFPFEMGNARPMRPMQGYLFKLPFFFTKLFEEFLGEYAFKSMMINDSSIERIVGTEYRTADEETSVGERDPFSIDPAIVERGLRSHAATQNALSDFLKNSQLIPLSPGPNEPNYDIAWKHNDEIWIAEIKSVTSANEEKQLRLGLGQILRYCQILKTKGNTHGILVIERAPSDPTWIDLCEAHNALLVWPEVFSSKIKV